MKKIIGFFIVIILVGLLGLWLYLKNFATKADVWSWENNYRMNLPLWVESLPQATGELTQFFDQKRKEGLEELGQIKEDKKAEFNAWLSGLEQKAEEAARAKAHQRVDEKFGITGSVSGSK